MYEIFGLQNTTVGTERLAYRLVWAYTRTVRAPRPDRKAAAAEFAGMAKAANAVGYGHTETHVDLVVRDVMDARPQPPFNATNSAGRIAWEKEATAALTAALNDIH